MVNTCSVTSCTESKTRRLLNAISCEAPGAKILVTGCMAQQKPSRLIQEKGIHWVVGNTFKDEITSILQQDQGGVFHSQFGNMSEHSLHISPSTGHPSNEFRTRFPVKIQEGCDFRCSYCIVPFLRGPSRCAPLSEILEVCGGALRAGYKELVLTGTHIGQFSDGGCGLFELLERLLPMEGDFRDQDELT